MRSKEVENSIKVIKRDITNYREELEIEIEFEDGIDEQRTAYLIQQITAYETLLYYISKLEKEIIMLENTKNTCPVTNTSGSKCDLKGDMKPFYHIERKKDVDG